MMTKSLHKGLFPSYPILLVSVINGRETGAALTGGADIIDLKNPPEGPLGAPSPQMIQEVCAELKGRKPFSIALGEFPGKSGAASLAALGAAFFQPDFIKIAFMPQVPPEEIQGQLQEIKRSITCIHGKKTIQIVSVAFADTIGSASWNLADFAAASQAGGAAGCLIDTFEKNGRTLMDAISMEEIREFIDACHRHSLFCGLAGSLKYGNILALKVLKPEIIGVRSAVCGGDRLRGTVSSQSVSDLKALCCRTNH